MILVMCVRTRFWEWFQHFLLGPKDKERPTIGTNPEFWNKIRQTYRIGYIYKRSTEVFPFTQINSDLSVCLSDPLKFDFLKTLLLHAISLSSWHVPTSPRCKNATSSSELQLILGKRPHNLHLPTFITLKFWVLKIHTRYI